MGGPTTILRSILRELPAGIRNGKCTVDPSRICPWLMLPPGAQDNKLYSLASKKVVTIKREPPPPPYADGPVQVVGSSHGWVASFCPDNHHIFLSDPITGRHMKLPDIPESFYGRNGSATVQRLILTDAPTVKRCVALMEYDKNRIGLCRPGRGGAWSTFGNGFYRDLVFSGRRKLLFAITDVDVVEVWSLSDPTCPTRTWATDLDISSYEQYLEEGLTKAEEEWERGGAGKTSEEWEGADNRYR